LYRVLRQPASEHYDGAYRRLRWKCGCTASGLSAREMLVKLCLHHHRSSFESRLGRQR
jgi:hypothetical protein